jgi:hypothetical protein
MSSDKTAYSYDPDTMEYTGEVLARKSPLEDEVWLLPAHSTFTAPVLEEGKVNVWDAKDQAWIYKDSVTKTLDLSPYKNSLSTLVSALETLVDYQSNMLVTDAKELVESYLESIATE